MTKLAAFIETIPEDYREVTREALRPRDAAPDDFFDAANAVVLRAMQEGSTMETSPFPGQRLQWCEMALAGQIEPVSYRIVSDPRPDTEHTPVVAITWAVTDLGGALVARLDALDRTSNDFAWTPTNGNYANGPHVFYDYFRSHPDVVSAA